MNKYEDIEITREYSRYPKGLRHYSKDRMIENSLFDMALIRYKLASLVKGTRQDESKRNKTGSEAESARSPKEILRGLMQRLLYEDGHTPVGLREDRAIEDRYIEIAEREREECTSGESVCQEAIQEPQDKDGR